MSRRCNCWCNAPQVSFYGHMKDEVEMEECQTFEALQVAVDHYKNYYNHDRYQWGLAKLAPSQYYEFVTTGYHPVADLIEKPEIPAVRTCDVNESAM